MNFFSSSPVLYLFILSLVNSYGESQAFNVHFHQHSSQSLRAENGYHARHTFIHSPTSFAFALQQSAQDDEHSDPAFSSRKSRRRNRASETTEETENIPCLPPIGESSYTGDATMENGGMIRLDGTSHDVSHVGSERFEIQYTCKVCETRNSHRISRMAYRNGIVITVCSGCLSKHLIADNLGWTKYVGGFDGDTNIEEFMKTMGREDEVERVSQDVFHLENILNIESQGKGDIHAGDSNTFE